MAILEVLAHPSDKYGPRTWANAGEAGLTVAFASDFSTAGERLTHKAAGDRYLGIQLSQESFNRDGALHAARLLFRAVRAAQVSVLNVAGNGIYTLDRAGINQELANRFVGSVIAMVHKHYPLRKVISGGQTGIDIAGAVAGVYLRVDTKVLLPRGFIQRARDRTDAAHSADEIRLQIETGARALQGRLLV